MHRYFLIIISYFLVTMVSADTVLTQPIVLTQPVAVEQPIIDVIENNNGLIPHGEGVFVIPSRSLNEPGNDELIIRPQGDGEALSTSELLPSGIVDGAVVLETPLEPIEGGRVTGVPFGTCEPATDPFQCAEPAINSFSTNYNWLKPGRKVSFNLSIDNYSEATLAAYDYYSQKLTIIQKWVSVSSQKTEVLKTKLHKQNNDTIYHLEVKNPHGQLIKSMDVFNFRLGQNKQDFPNANKNLPKVLKFEARPNPISLDSLIALNFAFIGADEYFLLMDDVLVDHKKNLNPDHLQEHRHRQPVYSKPKSNAQLVIVRNLSSDPEKNKRADKYLSYKTSLAAKILEFKSDKSKVKAGERVTITMKFKGATHVALDLQEDGGNVENMPLHPRVQMPLKRDREYRFSATLNLFSNTEFKIRLSNPDSGEPITQKIRIPVSKNLVTDLLEIRQFNIAKPRFAAGEKVKIDFVATNAVSYKLYSNETFQGPGTGGLIKSDSLISDNLGFVTKSESIVLNRPATELTLEITHNSGGSVTTTIPIEMYWKVKFDIPVKVSRPSPLPAIHADKLAVTCRVGDRYLDSNLHRSLSRKENYIKKLKGKKTVLIDLIDPRYHAGFGMHWETRNYLAKFEHELEFKPDFYPSQAPYTCSFASVQLCKKIEGQEDCNQFETHTKQAKSYKEAYDSPSDPKYYHQVDFSKHGDFSTSYKFSIKKSMEWKQKP